MKKNIATILLLVVFLPGCYDCLYRTLHFIQYEGTYRGRIVDADTGAPIENVVVLGTWSRVYPNAAGASHKFYDARETVTDKNGEFSISGMGLKLFSNIEDMNVLIFKSGYEHLGTMPWVTLQKDSTMLQKVKWEDSKAIILLRKLSDEERKLHGTPSVPSGAYQERKAALLIKEINKEEIQFGRKPYPEK